VTGFDFDGIANAGQTVAASTSGGLGGDGTGDNPFEQGFTGGTHGLPVGGAFTSENNTNMSYQLESYSANNSQANY